MPIKGFSEEIRVIKRLISIFDRYSKLYKKISNGKFENYEEYIRVGFTDEEELIKPKLWLDFLNEILCFPKDEYIPEYPEHTGLTPDFTPRDLRAHPFIFEIKGSDCQDLSIHYKKVTDYIKPPIRWAVLTNMHQLVVYEKDFHLPVSDYSFDFLLLYKTFKSQPRKILEYDNTKKFLNFIERFKYREFTLQDKIEKIKEGIPWTGQEVLDADALIESIRKIVAWLYDDIKKYRPHLTDTLHFLPRNQVEFAQEIESIARELDRRRPFVKVSAEDLKTFIKAKMGTIEYQAVEIFLMRVAYFAMTRILIARMWEDIGLLEQILYDGGFRIWYERLENRIQEVLRMAFSFAAKQYSWLYAAPNNYNWYIPSEEVIINVLYEFSKYNLGKLNTDVLGTVYEKYVDDIDRKNKGQYYTPREIISLIWDLVGFKDETNFFNYENGKRKPKLIFDPAVGSAGFLVEAARRIQELSHYNEKELEDLYEVFQSLYDGLFGCDISLFAYYIAEVNLIIQITPIIKNIRTIAKNLLQLPFTLGLIPYDSLALHNPKLIGVSDPNAFIRNSKDPYERLNPLTDKYKKDVLDRIRETKDFDYICSNPPYIGEKGHKDLFRRTIESYPYWQEYYQGKMDYFYFFIILGLSKLKEGGKLAFITTSYWPTADGASKLRKYILDNALIQTIIDFGETKIFEGAPGQHNMIFILERCSSYEQGLVKFPIEEIIKKKSMHQIKIVKVKKLPEMNNNSINNHHRIRLKKLVDHIKIHIDKEQYSDDYIEVFYSAVKQGELDERAWNLYYSKSQAQILNSIENKTEPIEKICEIDCGIFSNADFVSDKYLMLIPDDKRQKLNIKPNDGIFVLTQPEVGDLLKDDPQNEVIKRTYKNSDIDNYYIDTETNMKYLLYIDDSYDPKKFPRITKHLEKYKEILLARLDRYGEKYPWWRLHRPHNKNIYESPKIVTSRWGKENNYAIQTGNFYENSDINLYIPKDGVKESIKYILGLLNSKLLNYWILYKGRGEGVSRQIRLKQIPIRRIDFSNPEEKKIHNDLAKRVEKIIELKKELAQYNKFFKGIRLTKLEGPEKLPEPDIYAITVSLPQEDQRILRTHQKVSWAPKEIEDFYLSKTGKIEEVAPLFTGKEEEPVFSIKLLSKDKKQISINAPKEIVNYLQEVLQSYIGKSWEEIKKIPIAKDLKTYQAKEKEIIQQVKTLLSQIAKTQNEIDEIVYDLYQISPEEKKIIQDAVKDRKETR